MKWLSAQSWPHLSEGKELTVISRLIVEGWRPREKAQGGSQECVSDGYGLVLFQFAGLLQRSVKLR